LQEGTFYQPTPNGRGRRMVRMTSGQSALFSRLMYACFFPNHNIKGLEVDHIDHDKLNDRLTNLRAITKSDNQRAGRRPKQSALTSTFRGVNWHTRNKRWSAQAAGHWVGSFSSELEAATARDEYVIKSGWPVEGLNFPQC
jgi:hypothetical protein